MLESFEAPLAVLTASLLSVAEHVALLGKHLKQTPDPGVCIFHRVSVLSRLRFTSTCVQAKGKTCLPGCRPCRQSWAVLSPSGGDSVGNKTQQLRQFLLLSVGLISASGRLITFQVQGPAGLLSVMHKENQEAQHTYS